MSKLGFTFYPKDWWTSDTFFNLDSEERYIYLECIFLMYQNDGYLNLSKEQINARLRTQIKPKVWSKITQLLTKTDLGYTHDSIKKRSSKASTSRENGRKGGRPKKPNNPPINLPLEYNIIEDKKKEKKKVIKGKNSSSLNKGNKFIELLKTINKEKEEALHYWLDYRKGIKKEITNVKTLEILIKKFNSIPLETIRKVVMHTVENNYQGLFWDKILKDDNTKEGQSTFNANNYDS